MLYWKDREITAISWSSRAIGAVYYGAKLVWAGVRSCFGRGFWASSKPWIGKDGWKN